MTSQATTDSRFLIDSGILIRFLRGDTRAGRLLNQLQTNGRLMASTIVVVEIYRGVRTEAEESTASNLFQMFDIDLPDYARAVTAARLLREYRGIFSTDRAVADAIIAASAIEASATLVTLNTRQFRHLPTDRIELMLVDQEASDWSSTKPPQ